MWFYLAIISVIALAAGELTQQHLLNRKEAFTPRTSAVLTFLFQSLATLPIILFTPLKTEIFSVLKPDILWQVILVTFISSFAMVFYLKSFQVKNISLSAIFISISVVVSTVLGIIIFGESTSFLKFAGIILILAAIVGVNYKNVILEKNHYWGLAAGTLFGLAYVIDKHIVLDINPVVYVLWAFFLVSFFGFIFKPKEVIKSIRSKRISAFRIIVISGIAYLAYNLFTFNAYVFGGEVGRVDAINNTQVFLIILFEYLILKHKQSTLRKFLAAFVAYVGVLVLGFY
ncbi:MAG: hypothetical protein A2687_00085 [Candidatus Levybacteria bacterium RIFCSPHIGHO2_01_FULL_38_26]|nr:MAG: hypothetical protein A2687_00085 [Candidatus Levybacteria bacterium RIFCSPHIGHO2_01_FULL_38_26]